MAGFGCRPRPWAAIVPLAPAQRLGRHSVRCAELVADNNSALHHELNPIESLQTLKRTIVERELEKDGLTVTYNTQRLSLPETRRSDRSR